VRVDDTAHRVSDNECLISPVSVGVCSSLRYVLYHTCATMAGDPHSKRWQAERRFTQMLGSPPAQYAQVDTTE
jgi:hypothetical protein